MLLSSSQYLIQKLIKPFVTPFLCLVPLFFFFNLSPLVPLETFIIGFASQPLAVQFRQFDSANIPFRVPKLAILFLLPGVLPSILSCQSIRDWFLQRSVHISSVHNTQHRRIGRYTVSSTASQMGSFLLA